MANQLVITIVLYQTIFSQTPNYKLLKQFVVGKSSVHLLVYDNSPQAQTDSLFDNSKVRYIHDKTNPGLAVAYNAGIDYSNERSGELLLLLDQDTLFDQAYAEELLELHLEEEIGAYVPKVFSHNKQISPVYSEEYINKQSKLPTAGIYSNRLMAINSGTALSQTFLKEIRSFNSEFPLDFLDHWLFWEIHQHQKKVNVLNHTLIHDLSVLDYRSIDCKRYESIIEAETLFYKKYDQENWTAHKKQLFFRTMKQFLRVKNRKIWRRTFLEYLTLMRGN